MDINNVDSILNSSTIYDTIKNIGAKFNLHIDQIGALDAEARSILTGKKKKEDLVENIKKELEVTDETSQQLVKEISDNIFLKIREILQKDSSILSVDNPETPEQILKHIEDGGLELPAPEQPTQQEPDLTEHLLENTVTSAHVEEEKTVTKIPIEKKKYSTDPYREPIN